MNLLATHCVADLTQRFSIEVIWLLNARTTPGCELPKEWNVLIVVGENVDPEVVQDHAEQNLRALALASELGVVVFPPTVLQTMPRPMLIKMAMSSGESLYQRGPQEMAA